jgi:hypothetical protein
MTTSCFACYPGPSVGNGIRGLCLDHKQSCQLADGAPLDQTLALAAPAEGQLEGSGLTWLYNPVFVVDRDGTRQRAYADFAGGGMAVYEDRFAVASFFEVWICTRDDIHGTLLADLAGRPAGDQFEALSATTLSLKGRSLEAFTLAWDMWRWHRAVTARHASLGHWPTSFEELSSLLAEAPIQDHEDAAEAQLFLATLKRLAVRRFGAGRPPA